MMKSYMIRPILYKCVTRGALAVTALLLWNRFLKGPHGLSLARDGCFAAGVLFLAFAWFSYLHWDGVSLHHLLERPKGKKKPARRGTSDLVDFADEHIVSFDELEEKEKIICSLTANLLCAGLFFLAAGVGALSLRL